MLIMMELLNYCLDKGAMIGAAGYFAYKLGRRLGYDLKVQAKIQLKEEEI